MKFYWCRFRQPIPDDGTIEVVDGAAQPDSVAEEPEEDDTFDETLETKPRFRRKKSVYEGEQSISTRKTTSVCVHARRCVCGLHAAETFQVGSSFPAALC